MTKPPILMSIDDDLSMATLIAELAESSGFTAKVSDSAQQFFNQSKQNKYDVIVIDLFMPNTDGFDLIRLLADQGCTAAIIITTGYDESFLNMSVLIAKKLGLNLKGSFIKPFQIEELKKLLIELHNENIKVG